MLRDVLLEILATAPDVEILDASAPSAREEEPEGTRPDVVVMATQNPEDEAEPALTLFSSPRSRVLTLSSDARQAFLYELRPHRTALGELSRDRLLEAVRAAAAGGGR